MSTHPALRPTLPLWVALCLGLLVASPATAGEAGPVSLLAEAMPFSLEPQELLAAAAEGPAPEDSAAEILLLDARFTVQPDGRRTLRRHLIYRILTPAGVEGWGEVSSDYAPWYQDRPVIRARVILPSGDVHALDPGTLTETSIESPFPNTYQDLGRVLAPLPAVAPGVVVEELVEVADRESFFESGVAYRQPLVLGEPIRIARVVVETPKGMDIRFEARPEALAEPRVERSGELVRRVFEIRDLDAFEGWPAGLPPEEVPYPFVAFATGESWASLARAYSQVVDHQIAAGGPLSTPNPLAGAEVESQWEQIAWVLRWVHQSVRYTGVQLGEAAILPRPPAETLARRYGDCKDKATLVVALLRERGVPAYLALLRVGTSDDVLPDLPGLGPDSFDHAIVYVPGKPALWIDATDPHAPLGELPEPAQGRFALVASPNTGGLIRTPVASADANGTTEERQVFLAEYGPGRVIERSVLRGAPARGLRAAWEGLTEKQIVESLAEYTEATYGSATVTGLEHSPIDVPGPFELRFEVDDANWAMTDFTQGVVGIPPGALLQHLPHLGDEEDEAERTSDFLVGEPHTVEWLYRIHVPDGFTIREVPEDLDRSLGPAILERRFELAEGEVRARLRFRLDERRISADQLAELRDAARELREDGELLLWFDNVGWKHLVAGRVEEAVDEYRRLERAHPDEVLHKLQLANAVLEVGLIDEVRRLARRAVELEPESSLAHATLGQVLLHDPLGRQIQHGFERGAAIAALRRARELEPDDVNVAVNLALALEHDATGRRYGDADGVRQAIEVYREIDDELGGTIYENNLPIALLQAGRPQEALDLLESDAEDPARYGLLVTAEALANGTEAAIRRAERRLTGGRTERATVLRAAAANLVALRRYAAGAALMRLATEASSDVATTATLAVLEAARRHEDVSFEPEDPATVVFEFLRTTFAEDPEVDPKSFLASQWIESYHDAEAVTRLISQGAADLDFGVLEEVGLAEDVPLDFLASLATWTAEEQLPLGYVVRAEMKLPGVEAMAMVAVVVREGDSFRIAGLDEEPETYGRFAYDLARSGEEVRARAFLDRALELTEPPPAGRSLLTAVQMLHSVWPQEDRDSPDATVFAAAVLACQDYPDAGLVELLRTADVEPRLRNVRDQALANALMALERWDELLPVAERLEKATGADLYLTIALSTLGRFDELAARLERQASEEPDEDEARHLKVHRADVLKRDLRFDEAMEAYAAVLEEPGNSAQAYNNAAWLALSLGELRGRTLEWARLAVSRSESSNHFSLHTLATIQAEMGALTEAYGTLLDAANARPGGRPDEVDWYVLGRIAEHLGLETVAREYYGRLKAPEDERKRTSIRVMAWKRLRSLDAEDGAHP